MEENRVKILFRFYSDLLEKDMVQTVWAKIINEKSGFYQIDNIPFYVPNIASDDIVHAKFDKTENHLVFQESVEYSGNSLIRVLVKEQTEINTIRDYFKKLDCTSERNGDKYFAMEIPKQIDYTIIKKELHELETNGKIEYAEAVLSEKHKY